MILSHSLPINDPIDSPARFSMVIGANHSGVHFSSQDAFVVGIRTTPRVFAGDNLAILS